MAAQKKRSIGSRAPSSKPRRSSTGRGLYFFERALFSRQAHLRARLRPPCPRWTRSPDHHANGRIAPLRHRSPFIKASGIRAGADSQKPQALSAFAPSDSENTSSQRGAGLRNYPAGQHRERQIPGYFNTCHRRSAPRSRRLHRPWRYEPRRFAAALRARGTRAGVRARHRDLYSATQIEQTDFISDHGFAGKRGLRLLLIRSANDFTPTRVCRLP